MSYRTQLKDALDENGRLVQEAVLCNNPSYLVELLNSGEAITRALEKVVDSEGNDQQDFDETSVAY